MTREELLKEARENPNSEIYQLMQKIKKWQEKQHQEFSEYMNSKKEEINDF